MCGIAGYLDLRGERPAEEPVLRAMAETLRHRGPDDEGYFTDGPLGFGFRRLKIIDLEGGAQPMTNEDGSLVLVCNGEIFNYRELREELIAAGHAFRTRCDVEVLLHLYEEHGPALLDRINGQFAFALWDRGARRLLLARDHFGVNPLFYATFDGTFLFGSEIKAILAHPSARREVDLTGLDQVMTFPGLVSPRTVFRGIASLAPGHLLLVDASGVQEREYWDLLYPCEGEAADAAGEDEHVARLAEALERSVRRRLQADVPVGFYLSGGLDSSLIAALIHEISPQQARHSFSIDFVDASISETRFQETVARRVGSHPHRVTFDWNEIASRLERTLLHCECPLRETYNTCSLALSAAARGAGVPVVLTGEGSDELIAGYVGYRFDRFGLRRTAGVSLVEEALRERLWGDRSFVYELDHTGFNEVKTALYSEALAARFAEFDCLAFPLVDRERLRGRHPLHKRSYLDFKLRLSDHLLSDHGDRMAMAHAVEARYPFLDLEVVAAAVATPPELKLHGLTEKYVVKRVAAERVPPEIVRREKFGFHAPGSAYLLQQKVEWVEDMLSPARIARSGYFNPQAVARLKESYSQPGFKFNPTFECDLL
ncbi:MAG TPA: asparagine synthase (glutamine-hydrolyzing), partial [Solirubrobacterales bacterium]|nr:asparagine synthase (glutamine-hydrolyzing) [Solirubrobacterales bacterium]